jgi:predicted permease
MTGPIARFRQAVRGLLAQPGFFATATLTLALGVAALAAIFTVYDAVLLRPLPYADAARLVDVVRNQPPVHHSPVSRPVFEEWRDAGAKVFDAFGGYVVETLNLTGAGAAERLSVCAVTPGFWSVFGQPLALGQAFGADEESGHARVAVLSDALWRNRFNAAPDIVGRDIELNGEKYRVTGVTAASFAFPEEAQVWVPTWLPDSTAGRGMNFLSMVAKLAPGASLAGANQALAPIAAWEARKFPDAHAGLTAEVRSLQASLTGRVGQPLAMLLAASALVLLIACANLANLMLARGQARQREYALRRALGADRAAVMRAVLAEAAIIAVLGAAIGLAVAQPAVAGLMRLAPDLLPATAVPSIDWRVIAIVLVAAFAALALAGLAPALRATRADPADTLRGSGHDTGSTRGQSRLRAALVAAEIALALTLLCGSTLLIQSLRHLDQVDTGIDPSNVLTARIALPVPPQHPGEEFLDWQKRVKLALAPRLDAILERVQSLPGAARTGLVDSLPVAGGGGSNGMFSLPGHDIPATQALVEHRFVSPDYFHTLGIPLEAGRLLDAHDAAEPGFGSHVLVNQAFVDRYLDGKAASAVGLQISVLDGTMKTIVGVVGSARQFGLDRVAAPESYYPIAGWAAGSFSLVVKVDGDALAFAEPLRRALKEVAPDMPVFQVRTMDEATRSTTAMRRFNLSLMSVFAMLAIALAAIGLYGVIAYAVGQRRREIGLRQAIGARAADIRRLLLGDGLRMIIPGLALGALGAIALDRLIAAELYGVGAIDVLALAAAAALLAAIALAACAVPSLRAARVSPMEALRDD